VAAVFFHEGRPYAVDNRCPHMDFPLSRGTCKDGILTCEWHYARFDLATGGTFDLWAGDVETYPVEVRDGDVWVDLGVAFADAEFVERWRNRLQEGL
jgi:nitrite reductase/ring-hydroxylating ferredoxin subunit